MPIRVERSVDDPIVTFTFEGVMDSETIQELKAQTAQLITEMGTFYGVIDLGGVETTVSEAVALLERSDGLSLSTDPRVSLVFVGRIVPDNSINQTGAPIFDNKEDAWEYIRREIAANAPGQSSE